MKKESKFKDLLMFFLRFGLSFLLLGYIFSKIDFQKTFEVIKSANPLFIFYAFSVFLLINALLLFRWTILIRALDLAVKFWDVIRFYCVGLFGNLFLPSSIGGDIIKIVGLCRNHEHKPRVVASVLLDRLSGFAGVVIVGATSFAIGYKLINDTSLLIAIIAISVVSLSVVLILFNEKIYKFMIQVFSAFPKFKTSLMQMHYDVMLLKERKIQGFKAIGVSCFAQVVAAFAMYLTAIALHQDISFGYFLIFTPLTCVASFMPSIGGLGVREAAWVFLLGKIAIDPGIAVSISLINFLFMVLTGLLGGLYYVVTLYFRRV